MNNFSQNLSTKVSTTRPIYSSWNLNSKCLLKFLPLVICTQSNDVQKNQ